MIVLAPSRGRPRQAAELLASFDATVALPDTQIRLVVDDDDPHLPDYLTLEPVIVLPYETSGSLTRATNTAAKMWWFGSEIIGNVGDDHRFRTPGWDVIVSEALESPGIAYGDDGYQGANLPTAVFISSVIPRTLGWYALPGSHHLYIDNVWKDLGEALGRLHYLPQVSIEHMHASYGKSEWDEGYYRANEHQGEDHAAYLAWDKERDVALLKAVLG